jgi:hypothetical protein
MKVKRFIRHANHRLLKLIGINNPLIEVSLKWEIKNPDGSIKISEQDCNSYVAALIDILSAQITRISTADGKDTGGATRSIGSNTDNYNIAAAAGDALRGIVVGTGTNAVVIGDYALQTKIVHGVGAGQLQYGLQSWVAPTTTGSTRKFTISRTWTNGTANPITVNEVGIYCYGGGTAWYFCIERTLSTKAIAAAASATATYTISVTV